MSKSTSGRPRPVSDPVTIYLRARGVTAGELPPDMLRELTRLLASGQLNAGEAAPVGPDSPREIDEAGQVHHHDMLTFEMYLAAWIAREGLCDTPKKQPPP